MEQQLLAAFIGAFVAALLGSYAGYRYAIRNTPAARRPSGPWQLTRCIASAAVAAALAIVFEATLVIAFPSTDTSQLTGVPLLFGLAIAVLVTQRFVKNIS